MHELHPHGAAVGFPQGFENLPQGRLPFQEAAGMKGPVEIALIQVVVIEGQERMLQLAG